METKIEIKTLFGLVLFEFEKENNSIKDTIIEAVKNRANLRDADLSDADLSGVDLHSVHLRRADLGGADLHSADLSDADLSGANLRCADLRRANLHGANLSGADLHGADLLDADLSDADLRDADLSRAHLRDAHLRGVDLSGVDLHSAYLSGADLRDADLSGADLRGVDLSGAENIPYIPTYLPEGEFIAWKKLPNGLIVKLKILEDSKRSRATGDKCRCDKCLVLEFQNKDGSKSKETTYTSHKYAVCTYTVGEIVKADMWNDIRWNECSHGIHFFIDRQSAVEY